MNNGNNLRGQAFEKFEQSILTALRTYSNVHRGSGQFSLVTTHLFEKAREVILEYLCLSKQEYLIVFCTPARAITLADQIPAESCRIVSSVDLGLPLGVRAVAIKKNAIPAGVPFQTGGGTTRLVAPGWIIWADAPAKFEAGTPAIINIIAFARALQLTREYGNKIFLDESSEKATSEEILQPDEFYNLSDQDLFNELRRTMIGNNVEVPTMKGPSVYINLDNAASTPSFEPACKAFCHALKKSSAPELVDDVKKICSGFLGAPPEDYDVIFTSNTTESINISAGIIGREKDIDPVVVNTYLEHNSNDLPWRNVSNCSLIRLQVDKNGLVDIKKLEMLMSDYNEKHLFGKKRIRLMSVCGASNVLGTYNDIDAITRIVHRHGAFILVDAAQMAAHSKIDMKISGIDCLAFSGHKAYAPFGTGVLVIRKELLNIEPSVLKSIKDSGEENIAGIAALGKSLLLLQKIGMNVIREEEQRLSARAVTGLSGIKGLEVFGFKNPESDAFGRRGGVIAFIFKRMMADHVAAKLAAQGIGVRYGCHCAHLLVKHILHVSPFLEQFQKFMLNTIPSIKLPGVARLSLGIENTAEDVDNALRVIEQISRNDKSSLVLSKKEFQIKLTEFSEKISMEVFPH